MKLPRRVKILPNVSYKVVRVDSLDDGSLLGLCDGEVRTIYILKKLSQTDAIETLIHEVLHAIEFEYGIPIPHKIIYSLEEPIRTLMKLNKKP